MNKDIPAWMGVAATKIAHDVGERYDIADCDLDELVYLEILIESRDNYEEFFAETADADTPRPPLTIPPYLTVIDGGLSGDNDGTS